jgi:hypothetical protein
MKFYLDEFISVTNEIVFQELLQAKNDFFMLVGGQAVNASIHPINITSNDIDVVIKPGISSDTVYKWLDDLELLILKEWKQWNDSKSNFFKWQVNTQSLQIPCRFMSPKTCITTPASFNIDRWLHVHNLPNGVSIKTISLKVQDRRIMDISDWSSLLEKTNHWWEDSILKWVPCPSYQIWVQRKQFSPKTEIVRGRRYFQVRIPRIANLVEMLKRTKFLESYFPNTLHAKQLYSIPKIFNSMERIKMLESVAHFREMEKFQANQWNRKKEKMDELKEMYKNRLLELDQEHLLLYKKMEDWEKQKKMEDWEKQKKKVSPLEKIQNVEPPLTPVEPPTSSPPASPPVSPITRRREKKKRERDRPFIILDLERRKISKEKPLMDDEDDEDDEEMSESLLAYLIVTSSIIVYVVYYIMFGSSFIKISFF